MGAGDSEPQTSYTRMSKRTFLQGLAALSGVALAGTGTATASHFEGQDHVELFTLDDRIQLVEDERDSSFRSFVEKLDRLGHEFNDAYESTYTRYGDDYAPFLFTKGMPLETDSNGDTRPEGIVPLQQKNENYRIPIAERSDLSGDEEFAQGGQRLFIGYQAAHTVPLTGMDPWRGTLPPAPSPTDARNAGEMVDLYAMEQLRDEPFVNWPGEPGGSNNNGNGNCNGNGPGNSTIDSVTAALHDDIDDIESGLEESWWYDTDRLFVEADTDDIDWGPYVSQYLLQDVSLWSLPIQQQYERYESGVDYNDTQSDWLATLAGTDEFSSEVNPKHPDGGRGYIATPRHLATIVNAEPPYQEYLIAALHLLSNTAFDPGLAYVTRDDGSIFNYTDNGLVGVVDLVARAARQALLTAFYQKWYVHFRCRPETYSGRIEAQTNGDWALGISDIITDAAILAQRDTDATYLSTAYEEGSPVHPAYPSGHSVIAGACGTVLKTMFANEDWTDDYYIPTDYGSSRETISVPSGHAGVYQEIDKLMSNIGLARCFAGLHYYSDHYQGIKLGEQVGVGLLADVFNRDFSASKEIDPTFSPFLDYDTEYDISVETLETLRHEATSR